MTIRGIFCFASVLAVATVIGTSASSYAAQTCCNWVGGKYINLKTGKEVKPPKGAVAPLNEGVTQAKPKPTTAADPNYRLSDRYYGHAPLNEGVTQAKPKPATAADPNYRLSDRYYGHSDPYHGLFDYYAVPPYSPGYAYRHSGWR
jgi:hypothetical protein